MSLSARLENRVKRLLADRGFRLSRMSEDEKRYIFASYDDSVPLPADARESLRTDHPDLLDLRRRYDALGVPAAVPSQWSAAFLEDQLTLPWFRGDNAYVWQYRTLRNSAAAKTYLTRSDIAERDRLNLLSTLEDDGAFGVWRFQFGDQPPVSRDLLDSVNEINYLNSQVGLADRTEFSVLDIGAGYGRLAHRMVTAFPQATYDCIDGVAESTFISDYYLRHRGVTDRARVVALDEVDKLRDGYTVAVNVHSFSECTRDAISWWMDRIAERDIEYLFIVPNEPELLSHESDGTHQPYDDLVAAAGYALVDNRDKHENPVLRDLIESTTRYFLFKRR